MYFCSYHLKILNVKIVKEDTNVNWQLSTKNIHLLEKIAHYLLHFYPSWVVSFSTFPPLADNTHRNIQEHADSPKKLEECQMTDRMALCTWKVVTTWLPQQSFPLQLSYLWPRFHWEPRGSHCKFMCAFSCTDETKIICDNLLVKFGTQNTEQQRRDCTSI